MPTAPESLLAVAVALQHDRRPPMPEEARARSVLNRAYFAVYLATRERVRRDRGDPQFDASHTRLAASFRRARDRRVRWFGAALDGLRRERARADYRLDATITMRDSAQTLRRAHQLLAMLPDLAGRLPPI